MHGELSTLLAAPAPGEASATLEISAGGGAAASETSIVAGDPITLHWKATAASSVELTADLLPGELTAEGTTGEGGELTLDVNLDQGLPATLTMFDGNEEIATWEVELEVPEKSSGELQEAADFETLLSGTLRLKLDETGNGEGDVTLDPGPAQSAIFTLRVVPKDDSKQAQNVQVTAKATKTFSVVLLMPDGTEAPPGMKCKLTPALLAGSAPDDGQGQVS